MSERFEVDVDHLLLVWDTEKNKRLEIEGIVDLLNELVEENEALKKFIKDNFNKMMDSKMVIDDERSRIEN